MSLSILAAVCGAPDDAAAVAVAADLAWRHGSIATVADTFAPVPTTAMAPAFAGGALTPQVWEAIADRRDAVRREAESLVARINADYGVRQADRAGPLVLTPPAGTGLETLLRELPLADLAVVGQSGATGEGPWTGVLGEALMEANVAVLVCRDAVTPAARPAAIAWDGSFEASRAVKAALPLLRESPSVAILQDPEHLDPLMRDRADPARLSAYLAAHGVTVGQTVAVKGRRVGEAILEGAQTFGAALLVAGAYRHSRLREALFGGATRGFLEDSHGPHLLLSH